LKVKSTRSPPSTRQQIIFHKGGGESRQRRREQQQIDYNPLLLPATLVETPGETVCSVEVPPCPRQPDKGVARGDASAKPQQWVHPLASDTPAFSKILR